MHRLIGRSPFLAVSLATLIVAGLGCGNKKPAENASGDSDGGDDGGGATAGGDKSADGGPAEPKKDECVGFDVSNLEDMLIKSSCEEPDVKPDSIAPVDLKGKLEVTVSASPT